MKQKTREEYAQKTEGPCANVLFAFFFFFPYGAPSGRRLYHPRYTAPDTTLEIEDSTKSCI